MRLGNLAGLTAALLLGSAAARADMVISNRATSNVSCDAGVCAATAQKAVLNVGDLQTMLASGDVTVKTGSIAKDIEIAQALTWSSTARLTLDAQASVIVNRPVTVTGTGALTIATNDSGSATSKNKVGEFIILPERGSVQFWDLGSSLIIDGNQYALVGDIKTLASDIAANPSGFYALAKPYDASVDGTFTGSPIGVAFQGVFNGLGNQIFNFVMNANGPALTGLFAAIDKSGKLMNLGVTASKLTANGVDATALMVGNNEGYISRCWAEGTIRFSVTVFSGGLVAFNGGSIANTFAHVRLDGSGSGKNVGGLVGYSTGKIASSYASGSTVALRNSADGGVGGIIGTNKNLIRDSFALDHLNNGKRSDGDFGGAVGQNDGGARIANVYAAGEISQHGNGILGGLIGFDDSAPGSNSNTYWDLDKGISDPSRGAGNIPNDPGITGLTTKQLQSGLPEGFDSKVWGIDPKINHGFPYLLVLPPR